QSFGQSLSGSATDDAGHPAGSASIERAGAFRVDLNASRTAGVFYSDLENRVVLVVADLGKRVEDRLLSLRIAVDGLKEAAFFFIQLVFVCHVLSPLHMPESRHRQRDKQCPLVTDLAPFRLIPFAHSMRIAKSTAGAYGDCRNAQTDRN